jgi:hypothetical protein
VRLWVINTKRKGAVNITALTTTLVGQTSATKGDEFVDASILRVDKVTARVGCAATEVRHAGWVTVHDGNHSVIGLIHVYAKGDLTRTAIVVYVTNAVVAGTRGASEVSNYATKTSVSNQHEVIGRTSLLKDACDDVVEGFFTELRSFQLQQPCRCLQQVCGSQQERPKGQQSQASHQDHAERRQWTNHLLLHDH